VTLPRPQDPPPKLLKHGKLARFPAILVLDLHVAVAAKFNFRLIATGCGASGEIFGSLLEHDPFARVFEAFALQLSLGQWFEHGNQDAAAPSLGGQSTASSSSVEPPVLTAEIFSSLLSGRIAH